MVGLRQLILDKELRLLKDYEARDRDNAAAQRKLADELADLTAQVRPLLPPSTSPSRWATWLLKRPVSQEEGGRGGENCRREGDSAESGGVMRPCRIQLGFSRILSQHTAESQHAHYHHCES